MLQYVKNLGSLLKDISRRFPNEPGFIKGAQQFSWKQINARVDAMAHALRAQGIGKGDRILIHSTNNIQLFESAWVAFRLGAIWVPTNFRITEKEIAYLAKSSRASVLIYDHGFAGHADASRSVSDALQHVIALGDPRDGELGYEQLLDRYRIYGVFDDVEVMYEDPLWFFYTSGTTGYPKAGVLSHGQMAFVINNHLADLMPGIDYRSRSLVVAPLSHGAGIHALVNTAKGAASILPVSQKLDGEEVWSLVARYSIDNMFTVPTIVKMLTEHPAVDRYDHHSLKYVIYAGAPMYRADQKHALNKLGKVLVQYYGLGEVTGNITVLPADCHELDDADNNKAGTCGFPRTGMEIAILDDSGKRLPSLETGEICVRGPAVFMGYDNNPDANEKAFKFGWFHTGDIGHMDEDGYLYITGRQSDMYISGGSNVYPREIEEILLTHIAISEVAVLGVPDEKWGEIGVAVVVPKPDTSVSEQEISAFITGKLARYKHPAKYYFWTELPKSGYGKIVKKDIKARLQAN